MKNTNSLLNDAWAALSKNKAALISATTMAVMVLMVLFGPIFSPYTIDETDWYKISAAPSLLDGHIFGTDVLNSINVDYVLDKPNDLIQFLSDSQIN